MRPELPAVTAVLVSMRFARLLCMLARVRRVAVGDMRVLGAFVMRARLVVLRRLPVVARGLLVVLGSLDVVLRTLVLACHWQCSFG